MQQYDACMELHRAGRLDEAVATLEKLVAEQPDFALTYNALGAIHKKQGDLPAAIGYAQKYCEFAPDDAFGYTILSSYQLEAGNRPAAEEALGKAYDLRFKEQFGNNG